MCYFPDSTTIPVSTDYFDDTIGVVYTSIVLIMSLSVGCVSVASAKKIEELVLVVVDLHVVRSRLFKVKR